MSPHRFLNFARSTLRSPSDLLRLQEFAGIIHDPSIPFPGILRIVGYGCTGKRTLMRALTRTAPASYPCVWSHRGIPTQADVSGLKRITKLPDGSRWVAIVDLPCVKRHTTAIDIHTIKRLKEPDQPLNDILSHEQDAIREWAAIGAERYRAHGLTPLSPPTHDKIGPVAIVKMHEPNLSHYEALALVETFARRSRPTL